MLVDSSCYGGRSIEGVVYICLRLSGSLGIGAPSSGFFLYDSIRRITLCYLAYPICFFVHPPPLHLSHMGPHLLFVSNTNMPFDGGKKCARDQSVALTTDNA